MSNSRNYMFIFISLNLVLVAALNVNSLNNSIRHLLDHEYLQTIKFMAKFKALGGHNTSVDDVKAELCLKKLQSLMNEVTSESIGFLDAAGKPGSGIISGNLIWIGNYGTCETLRDLTKQNYRNCEVTATVSLAGVPLPNPMKWTGCLPPQCLHGNLNGALPFIGEWVSNKTNGSISFSHGDWLSECSSELHLDAGACAAITILSAIGLLVAAGTLWLFIRPIVPCIYGKDDNKELIELLQSNIPVQVEYRPLLHRKHPTLVQFLQQDVGHYESTHCKEGIHARVSVCNHKKSCSFH